MPKSTVSLLLALAWPLAFGAGARAQSPVRYALSFPNAVHHEAQVQVTFTDLPAEKPLQVHMARSSPGRYALHEFAKNIYEVRATDAQGRALPLAHPDPYSWTVTGHGGTVQFSYTLYGDRTDGTYAGIDAQHAHLNIPATLAYADGLEQRPAEVRFALPPGWQVATQLQPTATAGVYTAPHLQYLMDSPTSLGPQKMRSWQEQGKTIELAVLHTGTDAELDAYADQTKKIVKEAAAIFGGLPDYDFGRYTFVANYLPQASGDGMEHRNSTSVTNARPLSKEGALGNLSTVSHEFFHGWNVERIRPRDLEPFRFDRANMSSCLWFAEGFTQYYGDLLMRRSGALTNEQFAANDLSGLVNAMLNAPGAKRFSPVHMSQQAPFVDAAAAIDPNNRSNTYLSYYLIGGANALALDLELRQRFKTDLDAFMREVWQQHGKPQRDYAPARPYTLADLQRILGKTARDTAFAGQFFRQHIQGHTLPNFTALLAPAGMVVRKAHAGRASLGVSRLQFVNNQLTVGSGTLLGDPLYVAGLDRGDQLLKLDGKALKDQKAFEKLLGKHKPGDVVQVEVRSRGQVRTLPVTLQEDEELEVVLTEKTGQQPTPEQLAFRAAWLDAKAK
ncbi:M61 family metallopeptidase [Hymenobacter lutimineralis]|uniref:M61 family metallopeptidase n=1 Tax=Hymenobacter lutimineralis TaxID=2606448 RepID=A0A5D6US81_9BACT|nr:MULTISPECIES: PDZ domain-containing protein [Hymenobacter]QIX62621.1 M61 family metallopeptidase [Hymenobacter sp. BT18]TYZ06406.1 M61 family metallopeptidase [Hymenobacter lutimineralis]